MTSERNEVKTDDLAALPAATHIGAVALQVSRLDRSIDYYTTILGLHVLERTQERALLGVVGDTHLLELRERAGAAPTHKRMLGLYHFAILPPDRAALGRLIRHLAERRVQPGAADHLVSEAIYLYDPDGLGIEVYADRPRAQWRKQDGELAMASDPLDMTSLLDAAGSSSWDGMPAGTVMGHVHLSVGDLRRAREFYHEWLGFDVMVSRYPGALFVSAGGYHHHLGLNTWAGPAAQPADVDGARLLFWELIVPSQAARHVARRLTAAGVTVAELEPGTLWGVDDPWRIRLHIRASHP